MSAEPTTAAAVLPAIDEATAQMREAAAAKKCWRCGCLHSSLQAIEDAFPPAEHPAPLAEAVAAARARLSEVQYDCLGCAVCYPAIAINALQIEGDICPTDAVEARAGWPPLPGSYTVLRYQAPVAVCTLADEELARWLVAAASAHLAIVGTLQTENLGIERLLSNILANPHIRFLLVCGSDSRQQIGHLPGQSLVALARAGVDERARIIGAPGKRPVIRNLAPEAIEHFRRTVEVIDLIGTAQFEVILDAVQECAGRYPGPAQPFELERAIATCAGYLPERMVSDPTGYFVVYPDRARGLLSLEHYQNNGVLDRIIEGKTTAEVYTPAIEQGLVSRLDHAAYLGQELARADQALRSSQPYVQDAAPEQHPDQVLAGCGCRSSWGGGNR
jgi:tetrahydromethanopterin S-methyltransferase subunit A